MKVYFLQNGRDSAKEQNGRNSAIEVYFLQKGLDSAKEQHGRNSAIKVYAYEKWPGQCGQSAVRAYGCAMEQTVLSEFVRASRSQKLLRALVGRTVTSKVTQV